MRLRSKIATGLASVVLSSVLAGGGPQAWAEETAGATPALPVLGHWRNHHPEDLDTPPGWLPRMMRAEATFGEFAGHWRNYHPPGDLPMNDQEIAAAAMGKSLHISWMPYPEGKGWAYTASGAYNATLDLVMSRLKRYCGQACWLSFHHEPENDVDETPGSGYTTEDFRGMWQAMATARERVGATNVKFAWILQGFEQWRHLYDDLWPGNDMVDIVGHDPYIRKDEAPHLLANRMVDRTRWLVENSTPEHDYGSKPMLIAEYGCDLGGVEGARGTDEHRATCLNGVRSVLDELAELGVIELEMFDARTDWINNPPSADGQAYLDLKRATESASRLNSPL